MSCDERSFLYASNSGVNNIPTGGIIPFGSVVRQREKCCGDGPKLDGDGAICKGRGEAFLVTGVITLAQVDTSSTPPVVSAALLQNGSKIDSSEVSENSNGQVTLPINCVIRNDAASSSVVNYVNTGVPVNVIKCSVMIIPV